MSMMTVSKLSTKSPIRPVSVYCIHVDGIFLFQCYIDCPTVSCSFTTDCHEILLSNAWKITSVGVKNTEKN